MTYNPGQVLTAAELNASIAALVPSNAANITGGYAEGLDHVYVTGIAPSTSTGTGAVVIAGGVGIGLSLNVGGSISAAGSIATTLNTNSSSTTTGAVVVAGGVGIGLNLNVGGTVSAAGAISAAGQVLAELTTDATNTATGALVVSGGVGIAKALWVGANANVGGALTVTGAFNPAGVVTISNNTPSTNSATGALIVTGGVGIAGAANVGALGVTGAASVGGQLNANAATASTSATTGALVVAGGVGVGGAVNIGGALKVTGATTLAGNVAATASTASTNSSTGAVVVTGGVGVGGALNVAGSLSAAGVISGTNATASTSATTGAFVVTGGVGIGGSVNIGGSTTIAGALATAGLINGRANSNLLYNSTGEFNNLGWTGTAFSGSNDSTGANGSEFSNAAAISAAASDVSQNIPVGPGIAMSLSADISTSGVTSGAVAATMTAFSATNANLGVVCSITLSNGSAFARQSATGTTPANTAYVQISKGISGSTVAVTAIGASFKRMKVELGSFSTLYSQEASFAATSAMSTTNPTIASGPLTFSDGTKQYSAAPGKNRIINGQGIVNQRGNVNFATNAGGYGGPDRWACNNTGTGAALGQATGGFAVNGVSTPCIAQSVVTAGTTLTSGNFIGGILQAIEGANCFDMVGQPATLSFWFYATLPGTYNVSVSDYTSTHSFVAQFSYTTAITAQFVTIPVPSIPNSLSVPYSSAGGMIIRIGSLNQGAYQSTSGNVGAWQTGNFISAPGATTWTGTVNNLIAATCIQFEKGTVATPYEWRDYSETLEKCLRYYQTMQSSIIYGYGNAGSYVYLDINMMAPMRIAPGISPGTYTTSNVQGGSFSVSALGNQSLRFQMQVASTGTAYMYCSSGITSLTSEL